jgi:predicted nuclease of predicted toxin-antitoxin system
LPPALARWIEHQGHKAIHAIDIGLEEASDAVLWEHARTNSAVIISKDEDFVDRWLLSSAPVPLVWIRRGNCSNRLLIMWLEPLWSDVVTRLERGEHFVELRSGPFSGDF